MRSVSIFIFLSILSSFAQDQREELYTLAYKEPDNPKATLSLIESEEDGEDLRQWLTKNAETKNDSASWKVLAYFYLHLRKQDEALLSLDRAVDCDENNLELRLLRSKTRYHNSKITGAIEDLDFIRDSGKDNLESIVLRLSILSQTKQKHQARKLSLEFANKLPESATGADIEAAFTALWKNVSEDTAIEFLQGKVDAQPGDWRLQFLLGTVLAAEGKKAENIAVFKSLLNATGTNANRLKFESPTSPFPIHVLPSDIFVFREGQTFPGFFALSRGIPDDLKPDGWTPQSTKPFQPKYFGYHITSARMPFELPSTSLEARAMSFRQLTKKGESVQSEGLEYPELLTALLESDNSFEEKTLVLMNNAPDDLRIPAIFLEYANPDWARDEVARIEIWKALNKVARTHPAFAIWKGNKFFWNGAFGTEEYQNWLLKHLQGIPDPGVVEAAASLITRDNTALLRERLFELAMLDHNNGEPRWITPLLTSLLQNDQGKKAARLINRYARTKKTNPSSTLREWQWRSTFLNDGSRSYEQMTESTAPVPGKILPPIFQRRIPSAIQSFVGYHTNFRESHNDGETEQGNLFDQLQNYYPELKHFFREFDALKGHLAEISDPGVRAILARSLNDPALDGAVTELEQSHDPSHRMILSWIYEDRGEFQRTSDLLQAMLRDELTLDERIGLDQRILMFEVLKMQPLEPKWDQSRAKDALMRCVKSAYRSQSYYLEKLAKPLGLEQLVPKPMPNQPSTRPQKLSTQKTLDSISRKEFEQAYNEAAELLWHATFDERNAMIKLLQEHQLIEKVITHMTGLAHDSRRKLALALFAHEAGKSQIAEELYRDLISEKSDHFEAHLGLVMLQDPDHQNFTPLIQAVPLEKLKRVLHQQANEDFQFSTINDYHRELAYLGIFEELLRTADDDTHFSFAKSASNYYSDLAVGTRGYIPIPKFKNTEEKARYDQTKLARKKAIYFLMLKRPQLASDIFTLFSRNPKNWMLTPKELIPMAKDVFLLTLPSWKPIKYYPDTTHYSAKRWTAEEYLREHGEFQKILDEQTMALIEQHAPSMHESLKMAKDLVEAPSDLAEERFNTWVTTLPTDTLERRIILIRMIDNVLIFEPKDRKWTDRLEQLWLESMEPSPEHWQLTKELIGRWYRWRCAQGKAKANQFVEHLLIKLVGPKEAWSLLAIDRFKLPIKLRTKIHSLGSILPILAKEEAGREALFSCLINDQLGKIYRLDQIISFFFPFDFRDLSDEVKTDYFINFLTQFAQFTSSVSDERLDECGVLLIKIWDESKTRQMFLSDESKTVLRNGNWHPKLKSLTSLMTETHRREHEDRADPTEQDHQLFRDMMALDEKIVSRILTSKLTSRQLTEFEAHSEKSDSPDEAEKNEK